MQGPQRFPSPLNGERAGVRGGNAKALSNLSAPDEAFRILPVSEHLGFVSPLTLALSPLRGEGTGAASGVVHDTTSAAPFPKRQTPSPL